MISFHYLKDYNLFFDNVTKRTNEVNESFLLFD